MSAVLAWVSIALWSRQLIKDSSKQASKPTFDL